MANTIYSQNNLQFSKVITESFTIPQSGSSIPSNSELKTVPTGKVWKIESMGCTNEQGGYYEINGIRFVFYLNQYYSILKQNPIWLSAGTTLRFSGVTQYNSLSFYFSFIEFNIVQ